ncbi:MAG: hypothetical protein QXY01_04635 [Candidatus Bathyarchaeia archaeon]
MRKGERWLAGEKIFHLIARGWALTVVCGICPWGMQIGGGKTGFCGAGIGLGGGNVEGLTPGAKPKPPHRIHTL